MNHFADHADAARQHVCHRLWQRFGLAFSAAEVRELEKQIVGGNAQWVLDQPDRRKTVYRLKIPRPDRDRVVIAVFDIKIWAVCTVLPSEAWIGRRKPCKTKWKR